MTLDEMLNNLCLHKRYSYDFEDYEIDFLFSQAEKYGIDKMEVANFILSNRQRKTIKKSVWYDRESKMYFISKSSYISYFDGRKNKNNLIKVDRKNVDVDDIYF